MSCICMYGWFVCLCVKHENRYKFGLFYHVGSLLKSLFVSLLFCKKCERRKKIIQEPYFYPLRVTFSGVFAFATAVVVMTLVKDM
jgi:ATP/ADP translocase